MNRRIPRMLVLGFVLGMNARGQSVPVPARGNLELSGLGAFNFGGSLSHVNATAVNRGADPVEVVSPTSNGSIGIEFAASVLPRLLLTGQWGYIPGGRIQFNQDYYLAEKPITTRRTTVDGRASTMEIGGSAQLLLPLRRARQVIPYVLAGAGTLRSAGDLQVASVGGAPGQTFSGRFRTYQLALHGGGGLRYYFTEHTGFRVEMRAYRGWTAGAFGRLAFGIFYQFR